MNVLICNCKDRSYFSVAGNAHVGNPTKLRNLRISLLKYEFEVNCSENQTEAKTPPYPSSNLFDLLTSSKQCESPGMPVKRR